MGAVCEACDQDMAVALTCDAEKRVGVTFYGQDVDAQWYRELAPDLPPRCRDCGVVLGGLHHVHCCVAQCTPCQDQRLGCPCDAGDDG